MGDETPIAAIRTKAAVTVANVIAVRVRATIVCLRRGRRNAVTFTASSARARATLSTDSFAKE